MSFQAFEPPQRIAQTVEVSCRAFLAAAELAAKMPPPVRVEPRWPAQMPCPHPRWPGPHPIKLLAAA